jgi:hypothetical protein
VQAALSVWLTDQLMGVIDPEALFIEVLPERGQILAGPLSGALRDFVQGQVDDFLASETFANLWAEAVTRAHNRAIEVVEGTSQVVSSDDDQIVVNLVPLINAALAQVGEASPELFGRTITLPTLTVDDIPEEAQDKLSEALGTPIDDDFGVIRIDDNGSLAAVQDGVRLFGTAVWVLVILTVILVPLTLWLSRRRRRTLLQLVFGFAFVLVLIRRLGLRIEGDVVERILDPTRREAARSVAVSFVDPLLDFTVYALWVLAAIALVTLITGPYRWAVAIRRGAVRVGATAARTASAAGDRATDEATIAWLRANVPALQVGGVVVGLLIMLAFDLSWLGLFMLILLIAAYEAAVWWLGESATPAGSA